MQLDDSNDTLWTYDIIPSGDWQKITIPFSDFEFRGDYQKPGTAGTKSLAHNVIWNVQLIHSLGEQSAEGIVWIDEITLY